MIKKAIILAAGFGTRLGELTEKVPKALVPFRQGTMISYQIEKLKRCGISDITVNAHHFPELMEKYFLDNDFGLRINVIKEETILGTGGGIINAVKSLKGNGSFLAVNVDVFTDFELNKIIRSHLSSDNFATLLVQKRNSSRHLGFDTEMKLIGRVKGESLEYGKFAFNGVHVISDEIFDLGFKKEYSDIIDIYTEAIKSRGKTVAGYDAGNCIFEDLGKPEGYNRYNKSGD